MRLSAYQRDLKEALFAEYQISLEILEGSPSLAAVALRVAPRCAPWPVADADDGDSLLAGGADVVAQEGYEQTEPHPDGAV